MDIAIYQLYGSRFFPSDAADSADNPWAPDTCPEDKGPFGSGKPSFVLFLKYLDSNILISYTYNYMFLHKCHTCNKSKISVSLILLKNFHVFNFRGSRVSMKIF